MENPTINDMPVGVEVETECLDCFSIYWPSAGHDCKAEYFAEMWRAGFDEHEIDECWRSPSRGRILAAAIADGERWL